MKNIAQWPLRKPLALFAAALVGGVVVWSLVCQRDIPPNVKDLTQWFAGIVLAAYFASSTTEAVKGVEKRCPSDGG
jgi:uncharacterized membrane protein AbrB (regulator of aidB expression)